MRSSTLSWSCRSDRQRAPIPTRSCSTQMRSVTAPMTTERASSLPSARRHPSSSSARRAATAFGCGRATCSSVPTPSRSEWWLIPARRRSSRSRSVSFLPGGRHRSQPPRRPACATTARRPAGARGAGADPGAVRARASRSSRGASARRARLAAAGRHGMDGRCPAASRCAAGRLRRRPQPAPRGGHRAPRLATAPGRDRPSRPGAARHVQRDGRAVLRSSDDRKGILSRIFGG